MTDKRILVTGGSGFIGGYVYRRLREAGYDARNFDIKGDTDDKNFIEGDILDYGSVKKAVADADIVFHFAGFSNINHVKAAPGKCLEMNIIGTVNFLEAIREKGSGSFVFASSVYVHNKNGHFYTTSKYASELISENYSRVYWIPVTVLRLGTVYGERSRHEDVISIFTQKAVRGERITIHGNGNQIRHFIHGDDVANACLKLLPARKGLKTYILSATNGVSIKELAGVVRNQIDAEICFQSEEGREDDYQGDMGDTSIIELTHKELEWRPEIDVEDGVRRMLLFFRGAAQS